MLRTKLNDILNRVRKPVLPVLANMPALSPRTLGYLRDGSAGLINAIITIAYCVSFSALLFQGNLKGGLPLCLAALLMGSAITGLYIALTTTLSPAGAGPDTPAIAVMSVLATTVAGQVMASGSTLGAAKEHVMLAITLSTLVTGLLLFAIGALRLGQLLRFVPYPVIGGFLAASGWLMISGSVEVITGVSSDDNMLERLTSATNLSKLAVACGFAAAVLIARKRSESFFVLPVIFFVATVVLDFVLWVIGGATASSWYLAQSGPLELWWPLSVAQQKDVDWLTLFKASAETGAVAGVTAIALLLDVSSLEVARSQSADLDKEFRTNGVANLIAGALGGIAGNLSMQASILIDEAGGVSRWAGVVSAVAIALVLFSGANVAGFVPMPLLGGLLVYLGAVVLIEALLRAPAQRSVTDLVLALAILLGIVTFGYLQGVMLGLIGACLTFAFNYSRIGVVKRHLTRADFASNVERSPEQAGFLRDQGKRIHAFWLTGFIFFGSSNGLFERVRRTIDQQQDPSIRFILLDFTAVSGADTSAMLSLIKLRNYCDQQKVILVLCGLNEALRRTVEKGRISVFSDPHRLFDGRNDALEWCEETLLAERSLDAATASDFDAWLARELGGEQGVARIKAFFDRHEIAGGTVLYKQGEPSDTIDLVDQGRFSIAITDDQDRPVRLRTMSGQTVIGEMGFFRHRPRAASVAAQDDAVLYTLTRERMDRMLKEEPELGRSFLEFIIRALSDRVDFANREIAALI